MPEDGSQIRGISWSLTFPFLRLFRTFNMAIKPTRLGLCLIAVILVYCAGRLFDSLWTATSNRNAVLVAAEDGRTYTEIAAYATLPGREFDAWKQRSAQIHRDFEIKAVDDLTDANAEQAATRLQTRSARELIQEGHAQDVQEALDLINPRLAAGIDFISNDQQLSSSEKMERKRALNRAADCLRLVLTGNDPGLFFAPGERATAVERLLDADPAFTASQRAEAMARLVSAMTRQTRLAEIERRKPIGPFLAMLRFEGDCFAAAIQGLSAGKFAFSGSVLDPQPSMLASIAAAGKGLLWLVTQRPWFTVLYGLLFFAIFSFFGGAVCRMAALEAAREEHISISSALRFAREKFVGFLLVPVAPAAVFLGISVVMVLGGLVGALPVLNVISGLLYFLALLGGIALALFSIACVLGLNLGWPVIAVEGSDFFDAVSRGFSYVGQRIWHTGFYGFVLLAYGGICFIMVRLIALLTLKLTHDTTGVGMSAFGTLTSSKTDSIQPLDALWHMPSWAEMSLFPTVGDRHFWGSFWNAPLSTTESAAAFLITVWVFAVVGLVGAFIASFYLCGSTQMYYLLRREVDATDYDEVFIDEEAEDLFATPPAGGADANQPHAPTGPAGAAGSQSAGFAPPSGASGSQSRSTGSPQSSSGGTSLPIINPGP